MSSSLTRTRTARARAAGAEIVHDVADQDYGGRLYAHRDVEGHVWSFGSYDPWAWQGTAGVASA